jgi:acyl-homoserine lactone acylase PvdQ
VLQLVSMSLRLRIWGLALGVLALIGLVIVAGARHSLPQISGVVRVPGLHGPATVARDRWGVPHIYAEDAHDLSVAQGYVTAQDRLWQMLYRRQAAHGQLSDWLGTRAASADDALGRQDFYARADLAILDAETREKFEAYALGVNACRTACPVPPELTLLKLQGQAMQIAPWTATDSLALSRMMQWAQTQLSDAELRSALSSRVGPERAAALWPEGAEPTHPALPVDPETCQALRLTGIPLVSNDHVVSLPGLPVDWYMATLRSERITIAGATWPGVPGVMVDQAAGNSQDDNPKWDLAAHLVYMSPQGWLQARVHGMMERWYYDLSARTNKTSLGNASLAVYQAWVWHLARDAFQDELGPELFARYWLTGLAPDALTRLVERPDHPWWDDVTTPYSETGDDIMRRAYVEALDDLGRHYGDLHTIWEWDTMHAAVFRHPLGGAWLFSWLNREVKLGGDARFDPMRPDDPLRPFAPMVVPSLRMKQDINGQTTFALAGGQSGNPFSPHYADLLPVWAREVDVPLQDAARQNLRDVDGVLSLTP